MTTTEINHHTLLSLSRSDSTKIIPSSYILTTSFMFDPNLTSDDKPLVGNSSPTPFRRFSGTLSGFAKLIRSFQTIISIPNILPTFRRLSLPSQLSITPSIGRKVTGTLFGNRRGRISFAVQYDPRSTPVLIIEFAVSTAALVKEMSFGLVRIVLECEKLNQPRQFVQQFGKRDKLLNEPVWTMYCNGRKCGHAWSKACSDSDWHVLSTVQSVSVGAGVIPVVEGGKSNGGGSEGELVYMRAKFERVVGSRDSEAYYMLNPDRNGGPELSIFMLRI